MTVYQVEIEEYFVAQILSHAVPDVEHAVFATAHRFADHYASAVNFAFVNAASAFETSYFEPSKQIKDLGPKIYKVAALFAADLFAAECLTQRRVTCQDIIAIWERTEDRVFRPKQTKKEGDRSPPL